MSKVTLDVNQKGALAVLSDKLICDEFWYTTRWEKAYTNIIKKVRHGSTITRVVVTRKEIVQ